MREVRLALVFVLAMVLGLFLAVPAEDVPETAFDESETQPYEGSPLFKVMPPQAAAPEAQDARSALDVSPVETF